MILIVAPRQRCARPVRGAGPREDGQAVSVRRLVAIGQRGAAPVPRRPAQRQHLDVRRRAADCAGNGGHGLAPPTVSASGCGSTPDQRSTVFPARMDGDDLGRVRVTRRCLVRQRSGSAKRGGEAAPAAARRKARPADPRYAHHQRSRCGRGVHRSTRAARRAQDARRRPDIASSPRRHGRRPIATCWTTSCSRRRSFRRRSPTAANCGSPSSAIGSSPPSSGRQLTSSTDVSIVRDALSPPHAPTRPLAPSAGARAAAGARLQHHRHEADGRGRIRLSRIEPDGSIPLRRNSRRPPAHRRDGRAARFRTRSRHRIVAAPGCRLLVANARRPRIAAVARCLACTASDAR